MNWKQRPIYAALAGVAVLLGIFGLVAEYVVQGETHDFDESVLLSLRVPGHPDQPIGPHWLSEAVRDITALGSYSVLTLLVTFVVLQLLLIGRRTTAFLVAGAVITGTIVSTVLKSLFDRPRPDLTGVAEVFSASFPSGHSLASAVTFLTIGAVLAGTTKLTRLRVLYLGAAILLTVLVGLSRIYLGVHYPTDVIAGWCLGAAWALGFFILGNALATADTLDNDRIV
jgi:undecaprenyl-diphosphatase